MSDPTTDLGPRLLRWLGWGREAAPAAASTAAPSPPAIPVVTVGEAPVAAPLPAAGLADACRAAGFFDHEGWAAALAKPMQTHAIRGDRRVAAFLANIAHETGGGARLVESFDYTPERLAAVFGSRATPHALALCRRPGRPALQADLADVLYGGEWGKRNLGNTEPGDGWRFRGRGAIQATGRANYMRLATMLGRSLEDLTAAMETRAGAAETAAKWWAWAGVNELADGGDIAVVRRRVNGGAVGLDDVRRRYETVLRALA
jgi:putative chitinase